MAKDLTGRRFGALVVSALSVVKNTKAFWSCRCDCGIAKVMRGSNLIGGEAQSCGCRRGRPRNADPNKRRSVSARKASPTYRSWASMKQRCSNPNCNRWERYGSRGIRVHDEWADSYETFLRDMGPRPQGTSLDRFPDPDGNYEPGNCRWATRSEQARNTSKAERLTGPTTGDTVTIGSSPAT